MSLTQARSYVTWPGRLESPGRRQSKPDRTARNDIIMTEPWCANSIYHQVTTMATVDEIINVNAKAKS